MGNELKIKELNKSTEKSIHKSSALITPKNILGAISVVIITIIVTGSAMFLHTLPGNAISKLKVYGKKLATGLSFWFYGDSSEQINENIIYSSIMNLENMGYDLLGYGLITDLKTEKDVGEYEYLDENNGVVRNSETDEIVKAESDFMMAYLISDNYIYTFEPQRVDDVSIYEYIRSKSIAIGEHFSKFFGGSYGDRWTSGFINIWNEDGAIGHRGDYYSDTMNFDEFNIAPVEDVLHLNHGFGVANSKFNIEGWAGRYGVPMELLLSTHLATLMPDLVYDIANTFDTKLNIILHPYEDSYVPYIENVVNHWYRDIYFTSVSYDKDNNPDGKTLSFVDYDYVYEDIMKDRWSLYETDDKGNFVLYVLSDKQNGEFATNQSDIDSYNTSKITSKDSYYIYNGSKEEAEIEKINVSKKAIEKVSTDANYLNDISWTEHDGVWTAYEEIKDDVVQRGDAQRRETNSKIKRMFMNNTYFRYDGTADTARAIIQFRKDYDIGYGALDDKFDTSNIDLSKKKIITDVDGNKKTYSLDEVCGKVSLTQDALNIFTMLENTHTIDADYVYRDLKELALELGYFEKEEVTDETPRLLAWAVPDAGSKNYPNRSIDKLENEFGTLIHSRGDINSLKESLFWSDETDAPIKVDMDGTEDAYDLTREKIGKAEIDSIQSVSGKKRNLMAPGANGEPEVTNDFLAAGYYDVDMIVRDWAEKFKLATASEYYERNNEEEYVEWLNTLGGVFAKYAGKDVQGTGDAKSFRDALKYTYGLMWIAGFEYCAGRCYELPTGDYNSNKGGYHTCDPIMDEWYEAGGPPGNQYWPDVFEYEKDRSTGEFLKDPITGGLIPQPENKLDAFNGLDGVGHSHLDYFKPDGTIYGLADMYIDDCMLDYNFLTNCNYTTQKVYYKAGLTGRIGDADDDRPKQTPDYRDLINNYGAKVVTEIKDLQLGDLIECFEADLGGSMDPEYWYTNGQWGHIMFVGEETEDTITIYTTGHDFTHLGNFRRVISKDAARDTMGVVDWRGIHLWDLESEVSDYNGYDGNEYVVSPVTGVLLDYGTYGESESKKSAKEERVNVDIKYENYMQDVKNNGRLEYAIPRQEYIDKVGYAKILVLDAQNYKKLESVLNTRWKNSTLVESTKSSTNYRFKEELKNKNELDGWSASEKTLYGYKEFLEEYEKYGIAGNIIYIDGFKCEEVDENFDKYTEDYPNGEKITKSYYDVAENTLGNNSELEKTKYEREQAYNTNSEEAENKIEAEAEVKNLASPSVGTNGIIFIKEGTVLGRTLTDKELIERERKKEIGTFEQLRSDKTKTKMYNVIGNYIRIIMRDKTTDTVVENVEDYMKLDKN